MERNLLNRELESLQVYERNWEVSSPSKSLSKIGFEFDINYGATLKDPPPPDVDYSADSMSISTHTRKNDGFRLKGDGNRIEIATKPFDISSTGKAEMQKVLGEVLKLTQEMDTLCKAATFHPATGGLEYKTKTVGRKKKPVGRPIAIAPSYLTKNKKCDYSGSMYSIASIFPIEGHYTYYRQSIFVVGASLQATMTIPLAKINDLINHIKKTESYPKTKFPLSGSSKYRLGLRSDALYIAQKNILKSRKYHLDKATKLSDGTVTTTKNYTDTLTGLLILMASYMVTSILKEGKDDYEAFAKAYLLLFGTFKATGSGIK